MLALGYSRKHKVWLLLDRINDRIEHTHLHEKMLHFASKNQCTVVGIEDEKVGMILVKQSTGRDKIGDRKIPFKEIPTKGLDKYTRATPMANYFENERVFLPKGASWLSDYESSLIAFPNGAHDEDVDCTLMAQNMEIKISVPGLGHETVKKIVRTRQERKIVRLEDVGLKGKRAQKVKNYIICE